MARPTTTDLVTLAYKVDDVKARIGPHGPARYPDRLPWYLEDPAFWDACIALGKQAEAMVSKLSGDDTKREVDKETSKETDFAAKFGYGFQFREPSQ